jgi:WD40 repeat protein
MQLQKGSKKETTPSQHDVRGHAFGLFSDGRRLIRRDAMKYQLLLVRGDGAVITPELRIAGKIREPAGEGLSVTFHPVRRDRLYESAKQSSQIAYWILGLEGIAKRQLWVTYEVRGEHVNVTGRSSDLLFALALITSKWEGARAYPTIAATGRLDPEGRVGGVGHTAKKIAASIDTLRNEPAAVIFFPAVDQAGINEWCRTITIPPNIKLHAVNHLEEALEWLGISLEKAYLRNPFRGLEPFEYKDHSIFFGRNNDTEQLVTRLLERETAGMPGMLVYGSSGCGKSSFLRAGVLPHLAIPALVQHETLKHRTVSHVVGRMIWRPSFAPLAKDVASIVVSIWRCWSVGFPTDAIATFSTPSTFAELILTLEQMWPKANRFVWVIDQLEELFSLQFDETLITQFGRFLKTLQAMGIWTVVSMRADFWTQYKSHEGLRSVFDTADGEYFLSNLSGAVLEDVILRPAKAGGLLFERNVEGQDLAKTLCAEAYGQPEPLPLLEFVLQALYEKRDKDKRLLTFKSYSDLGGLRGAVNARAAEITSKISESKREMLWAALARMTAITVDGSEKQAAVYTRVAATFDSYSENEKELLEDLVSKRLLAKRRDPGARHVMIELAHESVISLWDPLREWLKDHQTLYVWRQEFLLPLMRQSYGPGAHSLYDLPKLHLSFARANSFALNAILSQEEKLYIEKSQRRRTLSIRRRAIVGSALAIGLLACLVSVMQRYKAQRDHDVWVADRQKREAVAAQFEEKASYLLRNTKDVREPSYAQAARYALAGAAIAGADASNARSILASILWRAHENTNLSEKSTNIVSATFSTDGLNVLTISEAGDASIWGAATGLRRPLVTSSSTVKSGRFRPDGLKIVLALERSIQLWNAESLVLEDTIPLYNVASTILSTDGKWALVISHDGTIQVIDLLERKAITYKARAVTLAALSDDGSRVVTASKDHMLRVWDRSSGDLVTSVDVKQDVYGITVARDGRTFVANVVSPSASTSRSFVWQQANNKVVARSMWIPDNARLPIVAGPQERVKTSKISPDGNYVLTAPNGWNVVSVWDIHARNEAYVRVAGGIGGAAFSPDGGEIAVAVNTGAGGAVAVFRTKANFGPKEKVGAQAELTRKFRISDEQVPLSVEYSSDGKSVITTTSSGAARVWSLRTIGQLAEVLPNVPDRLGDLNESITAPEKASDVIDDWATSAIPALKITQVAAATFSPNGKTIMTTSTAGVVSVWDLKMNYLFSLGYPEISRSAIGSRVLAPQSFDSFDNVYLNTRKIGSSPPKNRCLSASFSADGQTIVTDGADGSTSIWSAENGREIHRWSAFEMGEKIPPSEWYRTYSPPSAETFIWKLAGGRANLKVGFHPEPPGERRYAPSVVSPTSKSVAIATGNGIILCEQTSFTCNFSRFAKGNGLALDGRAKVMAFAHDGNRLVAGLDELAVWVSGGNTVKLSDSAGGDYTNIAFGDERILTTSKFSGVRVWDATTYSKVRTFPSHNWVIAGFSADNRHVLTTNYDDNLVVSDIEGQQDPHLVKIREYVRIYGGMAELESAVLSDDGSMVATQIEGGGGQLWDVNSGTLLGQYGSVVSKLSDSKPNQSNHNLAFSPSGHSLITTSDSGQAMLVNLDLFFETLGELVEDTCRLLTATQREFTEDEINSDELIRREFMSRSSQNHAVCNYQGNEPLSRRGIH